MTQLSEPSSAPPPPRRPPLSLTQLMILAGFAVGVLILIDFNQRLNRILQTEAANARLRTEVADLEVKQAALQTQLAYATTDAAVIAWAHESGKLVRPGERLVVPQVTPSPSPLPPPPTSTPPPPASWELWWNLFFEPQLARAP